MPDDLCYFCGKSDNLVEFDEQMYCYGYCVDEAEKNAKINAEDEVKDDMRLWK